MINDKDFLSKLHKIDYSVLTLKKHKMLDKYVHAKEFDPSFISRSDNCCTFLCQWLIELHSHDVKHVIQRGVENANLEELKTTFKKCNDFHSQFPKFLKLPGQGVGHHSRAKSQA